MCKIVLARVFIALPSRKISVCVCLCDYGASFLNCFMIFTLSIPVTKRPSWDTAELDTQIFFTAIKKPFCKSVKSPDLAQRSCKR